MRIKIIACVLIVAVSAASAEEDPQAGPDGTVEIDANRNMLLQALTTSSRPSPVQLLKYPRVIQELQPTEKQLQELQSLKPIKPADLGFMMKAYAEREQELKSILSKKQWRRLEQIHIQYLMLFGNASQIGLVLGLTEPEIAKLNKVFVEANELAKEDMLRVKWEKYTDRIRSSVGKQNSAEAFGEPFYVDRKRNGNGGLGNSQAPNLRRSEQ